MPITKKLNETIAETIELDDLLTKVGITSSDVTAAVLSIKDRKFGTEVLRKQTSDSTITINTTDDTLIVNFAAADYEAGKLEAGNTYYMAFAIEYNNGGLVRQEICLDTDELQIQQDEIEDW